MAEHTVLHVMWRMQSGQLPTHQLMLSPVSAKSPGELEVSWEHGKMISLSETVPASVETANKAQQLKFLETLTYGFESPIVTLKMSTSILHQSALNS